MSELQLSIVLASSATGGDLDAVIAALEGGCEGISAELIVIRAGGEGRVTQQQNNFTGVRVDTRPAGTLTPVLWGAGLGLARAPVVAFTTDQMQVTPAWGRALLDGMKPGVAGVAGPIDLAGGASAATTAAYFVRFSLFTPGLWPSMAPAADIPGDNAAYRRDAALQHVDLVREGFWEVEFHRRFEKEGFTLSMVPAAVATLVGPVPFAELFRQRFRHGREFGFSRVQRHRESRAKLLLFSPLVPLLLLTRIGGRAWRTPSNRGRFLVALPFLALLATAWAAGEVAGALRGDVEPVR